MSNGRNSPASVRILDLNLADVVSEILNGQNLPVEKKFTAPRAGSLCERIFDEIERRADTTRSELFARHTLTAFSSGEHKIEYDNTIAGRKVFVVLDFPTLDETKVSREVFQITSASLTNNYIFAAKAAADAARRAGAAEVHLLMPNYAYARQDKTHKKRGPISAAIIANDLGSCYNSITCLHLHSPAIEGMLRAGGLMNISPNEIFAPGFVCRDPDTFRAIDLGALTVDGVNKLFSQICIASPDVGGSAPARDFAKYCKQFAATYLDVAEYKIIDIPLAIIDKRRSGPNVSEVMNVLGDVSGKKVRIVDDMGDTLGTLIKGSDAFLRDGALDVEAQVTHLYATGDALERLHGSRISALHATDSMAQRPAVLASPLVHITSIAPILTQSIADLTTQPESNLCFHARHLDSENVRNYLGRYVAAMTAKAFQTQPHP